MRTPIRGEVVRLRPGSRSSAHPGPRTGHRILSLLASELRAGMGRGVERNGTSIESAVWPAVAGVIDPSSSATSSENGTGVSKVSGENQQPQQRTLGTVARFCLFLSLFFVIVGVILGSGSLLVAPPYAVTAYLVAFNRESRYSEPSSIFASYLVVIASSEAFEFLFGISTVALVANVTIVALFIAFTRYSHPPALALTIFSYIVHDSVSFVLSSLVVLVIVTVADAAIEKVWPTRTQAGREAAAR